MIAHVRLRNFRRLKEIDLALGRLTILVGPNGCGKTSVLQGLELLSNLAGEVKGAQLTGDRPARLLTGRSSLSQLLTRPESSVLELDATTDGGHRVSLRGTLVRGRGQNFTLELSEGAPPNPTGTFCFSNIEPTPQEEAEAWRQSHDDSNDSLWEQDEAGDGPARPMPVPRPNVGRAARLALDPDALAAPAAASMPDRLDARGTHLASLLQRLAGLRDGSFEAVEEHLRKVVDDARRIRLQPATLKLSEREQVVIGGNQIWIPREREVPGVRFEVEFERLGWIPAEQLSEGTLLALGLITAVYSPTAPDLLLVDDLDRALHPSAQAALVGVLRTLLAERPQLQIVATTHSPYLADTLEFGEIRVMGLVGGYATLAALDTHAELPQWRERMRAGEFWATVGEDWVQPRRETG